MKLLLDENLSDKIIFQIKDLFPESTHVKAHKLIHALDSDIWKFAKEQNYVIVSKDWDFHQLSLLRGFPPKVIYLKLRNGPTDDIIDLLRRRYSEIQSFYRDNQESLRPGIDVN